MVWRVCKMERGRRLRGSPKGHSKQISLVLSVEILWTLHSGCSVAALQDNKRITAQNNNNTITHTQQLLEDVLL